MESYIIELVVMLSGTAIISFFKWCKNFFNSATKSIRRKAVYFFIFILTNCQTLLLINEISNLETLICIKSLLIVLNISIICLLYFQLLIIFLFDFCNSKLK